MATSKTQKNQPPALPQEILLLIVDAVVAAADARLLILPPSHPTTRTLVSLRLTSRRLYPIATQYLYARCLHIDSAARLERLLGSIQTLHAPTPSPIPGSGSGSDSSSLLPDAMPRRDVILSSMTSLYLSPALSKPAPILHTQSGSNNTTTTSWNEGRKPPNDEHIISTWILQLLTLLGPHLKRLIIEVPPTDHWRHYSVYRQTLTEALSRLTALDEFVSMQAEMVFNIPWATWHKLDSGGLRRLALPNGITMMIPNIIGEIAQLPRLEVLALAKPALVPSSMRTRLWRRPALVAQATQAEGGDGAGGRVGVDATVSPQRLLVMCFDTSASHYIEDVSVTWSEADQVRFMQFDVPVGYYSDDNSLDVCEEFVLRHALRGRLWDLQGRLLGRVEAGSA